MNRESLSNADWLRTVDRLGGAELLEEEAREFGAFQKARKVKCAVDHLRLVLAYCWSRYGLRWAAAWAAAMGLASLSNVAVLKRLRNSVEWLEQLVSRSLGAGAREAGLAAAKGRPVRLVDATSVAKAGRAARETCGRWRIHSVFDLASERFTAFEVTDESEVRSSIGLMLSPAKSAWANAPIRSPTGSRRCSTPVPILSCAPGGITRAGSTARETASISLHFSRSRAATGLSIDRSGSKVRQKPPSHCVWWRSA